MKYQCVVTICCGNGHRVVGDIIRTCKNINDAFKEVEEYNLLTPKCACRAEVREVEK